MMFYPAGGWDDLNGSFSSIQDAMQHVHEDPIKWDHHQLIDTTTMQEAYLPT
jgi:hypothetical protein